MKRQLTAKRRRRTRSVFVAVIAALGACNGPIETRELAPAPGAARFSTTLETSNVGAVDTGLVSANAQKLRVGCATCHELRGATELPRDPSELGEFHVGLVVAHGDLSCAACHRPGKVETFRLADGTPVATDESIRLCSQCHGPQRRDYQRGAHGGMRGFWDLSRGPRTRKVCIDCHDPHAPTYVGGWPVLGPRDRFLSNDMDTE